MARSNRRDFLKRTVAGSTLAAFALYGTKASGRVPGANDRVRIAVAGIHGRGQTHITGFGGMEDVEIAYLVDPDSRLFVSRSDIVKRLAGNKPTCVQDIRRALDDKSLDMDVNRDGLVDVVNSGYQSDIAGSLWYENPGRRGGVWKVHRVHANPPIPRFP